MLVSSPSLIRLNGTRLRRSPMTWLTPAFSLVLAACAPTGDGEEAGETSGASEGQSDSFRGSVHVLSTTDAGRSDVVGVHFEYFDSATHRPVARAYARLENQLLPGNFADFKDNPLAADSEHRFSDHFSVLPEGSYRVVATPLRRPPSGPVTAAFDAPGLLPGDPSEDCLAVALEDVRVRPGRTIELGPLIHQCAPEVVDPRRWAFEHNHFPQLHATRGHEGSLRCDTAMSLCLAAHDLDGQALDWDVRLEGESDGCTLEATSDTRDGAGHGEICHAIICPNPGAELEFVATVFDITDQGEPDQHLEDWVNGPEWAPGTGPYRSRAEFRQTVVVANFPGHLDNDGDGHGQPLATNYCSPADREAAGAIALPGDDCDDNDPSRHPSAAEICDDAIDQNCDASEDGCVPGLRLPAPVAPSPELMRLDTGLQTGSCARHIEIDWSLETAPTSIPDASDKDALGEYRKLLIGPDAAPHVVDHIDRSISALDLSNWADDNAFASLGNFPWTHAYPELDATATSQHAASLVRGFIHIAPDTPLDRSIGLLGADAATLYISGRAIATSDWLSGDWKRFRYVRFPSSGLYPFEMVWSDDRQGQAPSDLNPLEVVWAEGFLPGFSELEQMCQFETCDLGNDERFDGFQVFRGQELLVSSDGQSSNCDFCESAEDCTVGEACNAAGLCQVSAEAG